jgi:hypothetical protein
LRSARPRWGWPAHCTRITRRISRPTSSSRSSRCTSSSRSWPAVLATTAARSSVRSRSCSCSRPRASRSR